MRPSSAMREPQPYGPRPRLRGVLHAFAAPGFALAMPLLLADVREPLAWWSTAIFVGGLVVLFTISALYHRVNWSPRALGRMRRLDHAYIFVLIGCLYVPFCMLALPPAEGHFLLRLAAVGAALGVLRVLVWPYAPKPLAVTTYALLPLLAAPWMERIYAGTGPFGTACMVVGNAVVGAGALVYAFGRPDPWPEVFGAHEIFHLAVVACAICYTAAVYSLASAWRPF